LYSAYLNSVAIWFEYNASMHRILGRKPTMTNKRP
jgi:hypothetical protein